MLIWYMNPAWVALVPEKKPFTLIPQEPEQPIVPPVIVANAPATENVEPVISPPTLVAANVDPPAVPDKLTASTGEEKFPDSEAEFNVPGAIEPFARVGLVAPIRL